MNPCSPRAKQPLAPIQAALREIGMEAPVRPAPRLGRRALFRFAAAAGLAATFPAIVAQATPVGVTYTIAYTGADFTSFSAAVTAMGTTWTSSSTGNVTLSGATSSTVPLALTETVDWTGHPITIAGVSGSYLIISYNNTTKVATIGARAGYPATFATTPGTGAAYTIADIAVTLSIGQSSAGNNLWVGGSVGISISGITMDATHTLTIQEATPWNSQTALRFNYTGDPQQPVAITATQLGLGYNLSGSGNFIFLNNIQIVALENGNNGYAIMDETFVNTIKVSGTNCLIQIIASANQSPTATATYCGMGTWNNSVFAGDQNPQGFFVSAGTYNCCDFWGVSQTGTTQTPATTTLTNAGGTFNGCWMFNLAGVGSGSPTFSQCFSDTLTGSGITAATIAANVVSSNGQLYSDLRPLSGGNLGSQSGSPPVSTDIYGSTRSSGTWTAGASNTLIVLPAVQAVTYSVAASGGDITALTNPSIFDNTTGPDQTYFQSGQTCPSTAADSSHIVLATSASASVVGHPIQWKTGVICLCTAFSGGIATVAAIAGYPANFGGVPQTGDAYTIFPAFNKFVVGYPASGNAWKLSQVYTGGNTGALVFTSMSSPTCHTRLTSNFTFNKLLNLGDITTQPMPCIGNNFDHASIFGVGTPYFEIDHLQLWQYQSGTTEEGEGVFRIPNGQGATPGVLPFSVKATKCFVRNDNHSTFSAHQAFAQDSGAYSHSIVFDTCKCVNTTWQQLIQNLSVDWLRSELLCTDNLIIFATATVAAGSSTITVNSTAGIDSGIIGTGYPYWPSHPGITAETQVTVVDATHLSLSAPTIGTITNNDLIFMNSGYMMQWFAAQGSVSITGTLENTIICGAVLPVISYASGSGGLPVVTTCATEVAMTGGTAPGSQTTNLTGTGFTQISYPATYKSASGLGYQVAPDVRFAPGAAALAGLGTYPGAGLSDIFEQPWANPPSIGAEQFISPSGNANFFHAVPM